MQSSSKRIASSTCAEHPVEPRFPARRAPRLAVGDVPSQVAGPVDRLEDRARLMAAAILIGSSGSRCVREDEEQPRTHRTERGEQPADEVRAVVQDSATGVSNPVVWRRRHLIS